MWPITGMPAPTMRAHAREHRPGALELHGVGAGLLDEADGVLDRVLVRDLKRAERHVGDDERPPRAARRPRGSSTSISSIVTGTVESWPRTVIAAESPTRTRSTPAVVGEPAARGVVGGDHRDLLAAALHLAQLGQRRACPGRACRVRACAAWCSCAAPPSRGTLSIRRVAADAHGGGEDGRVERRATST